MSYVSVGVLPASFSSSRNLNSATAKKKKKGPYKPSRKKREAAKEARREAALAQAKLDAAREVARLRGEEVQSEAILALEEEAAAAEGHLQTLVAEEAPVDLKKWGLYAGVGILGFLALQKAKRK